MGLDLPTVHHRLAIADAGIELAVLIELPVRIQPDLVDIVLLGHRHGPGDLRAEVTDVQHAIAVGPHRVVHRVALDREAAAEIDRMGGDDRRPHGHQGRRGTIGRVRPAFSRRHVRVERQGQAIAHPPFGIETEGLERVFHSAELLLEADVLHARDVLLQIHGGRHRVVAVEDHFVEGAVEPVGLVGPLLLALVLRIGRIGRQGQRLRRAELHDKLAVHPFAVRIREVVAAVVRIGDEIVRARRIGDLRGRVHAAIAPDQGNRHHARHSIR